MKNLSYVFESKRLTFRRFELTDACNIYDLNSDPDVLKYTGDSPFKSIEEASTFLINYAAYETFGFGRWAVVLKETNSFIGWCGLKKNNEGFIDIGFRFFKKEWNKGFASEAATTTLDYGFKHLKIGEIIGRADIGNKASVRVLEKLGMKFWKKDTCNGIENAVYYSLSKKEYLEQ